MSTFGALLGLGVWHDQLEYQLGVTKKLGDGAKGTVYATDHGTVVKVSYDFDELRAAKAFQKLKHKIVPLIMGAGLIENKFVWIEREGLNDLNLSYAGEAQFTGGPLAYVLSGGIQQKLVTFSSDVPLRDRKILSQMAIGYRWLEIRGIFLQDHNGSQNWGLRADGSVAVRDLGGVFGKGISDRDVP